jgi:cell division transport system permease protein
MIFFYFSEAFRSIKSAKTSFLLTIVSLTISALLILFCFITLQISDYYSTSLKSNIKINVFIKEAANKNEQEKLLDELQKKNYSGKVEFISKEEAAEKFIKETGEDFRKILDYNPLPASFVVKVSKEFANSDSLNFIIKDLSGLAMVDEVVFKEGFIYSLLNYIDRAKIYLFILTTIVFMVAVYLVYATVRLIINSRMNEFETMKLVGAKLSTIKIPVVLNGLIAGLISGILAFIMFNFFQEQIKSFGSLIKIVNENMLIYLMVIFLTGPLLVILVSVFTLRKVSLNI